MRCPPPKKGNETINTGRPPPEKGEDMIIARRPPPKKGNERITMQRPPPEKGEERMSEPHQNELSYVACSAVSILAMQCCHSHNDEVAPRFEPSSNCMVMCFFVSLANPIKIVKLFCEGGIPCIFFSALFY